MAHSVQDIAAALGAEAFGAVELLVTGVAEPAKAGPNDLALAMSPKYAEFLAKGQAVAAIISAGMDWQALGLKAAIVAPRPRYAMAGVTAALDPGPQIARGIHPSAIVDASARISEGAAIGPLVVIGAGAVIGARARIASHVTIAENARIGDDALIMSGVRIGARVVIGHRVVIQPGAVIGGDGFSFVTPEASTVEVARSTLGQVALDTSDQRWTRIHSLGSVEIGDDVEIGANSCIDKGTVANTVIGRGTKLDNLVHVGHNCRIGQDCLLCGQVGIAGSTVVGDRVVMAGQVGVSDNITIGENVVAAGGTKIFSNVPAGRMVMGGVPAMKMETHVEVYKALRRLPRLAATVAQLQKAVFKSGPND